MLKNGLMNLLDLFQVPIINKTHEAYAGKESGYKLTLPSFSRGAHRL